MGSLFLLQGTFQTQGWNLGSPAGGFFTTEWPVHTSFPDSSVGKESNCNVGDASLTPGSGRPPGEGIGYPFQYSWASLVAQLVKNLPEMQETWVGKIPWRRERLLSPVFWPGEFHGPYSPWGCKELDRTERLSLSLWPFEQAFLSGPKVLEASLTSCRIF